MNDYYFEEKEIPISNEDFLRKIKEKQVSEYELYSIDKNAPNISVHAIVGKNGSGKSTILEILFRIINNFAHKTLVNVAGRDNNSAVLLYADNISASLLYSIENVYYCLEDKKENFMN